MVRNLGNTMKIIYLKKKQKKYVAWTSDDTALWMGNDKAGVIWTSDNTVP